MRGELLNEVKNLSLKETTIAFENVKKLLLADVKKDKKIDFDTIPDTTEPIAVIKEQYPNLPFAAIENEDYKEVNHNGER